MNALLTLTLQAVYSPDGAFILTCSTDKTAKLWPVLPAYVRHHWSMNRAQLEKAGVVFDPYMEQAIESLQTGSFFLRR